MSNAPAGRAPTPISQQVGKSQPAAVTEALSNAPVPSSSGNDVLDAMNRLNSQSADPAGDSSDSPDETYWSHDSTDAEKESVDGDDAPPTPSASESEQAPASETGDAQKQKASGDKEVITISDDKGRRKVEVDWSNRESIKKMIQMAHGARKWQAERDAARTESKKHSEELTKLRGAWDGIEKAFREKGEEGVLDLIGGREGYSQDWLNKRLERQKFLESASPAQLEQLKQAERLAELERSQVRLQKEKDEYEKRITEQREQAEMSKLESHLHPAFEEFRFDGQFDGDTAAEDEKMYDSLLWNEALGLLKPYEEQGMEISPALAKKAFRTVRQRLQKRLNLQAEKRVAAVTQQKKQESLENAQASTASAYRGADDNKSAVDQIRSGDLAGLFRRIKKLT